MMSTSMLLAHPSMVPGPLRRDAGGMTDTSPQLAGAGPQPGGPAVSATDLELWVRDGFHVARGLFAPDEVDAIRERFDLLAAGDPVPGHWEPRRDRSDVLARYPRVFHPHALDVRDRDVLLDPRVRTVLRALTGEDVVACQSMFYFKPPGARGQAFHQDNYYLRVRPSTCIAAWLAVDRSWPENGGLQVCPGTHRLDLVCPEPADLDESFVDDYVAPPEGCPPVGLDLVPGDVLFFPGGVVHGSGPNRTPHAWRRSFISHYMPVSASHVGAWYLPYLLDFSGRPVTRAHDDRGGPCGEEERRTPAFH